MSEWTKARKILSDFIGECNCMTSEDYQKAFNAVEVGDRLQEENNKLKLFENLLREINNADMGINIEIETGLWTCDKCGTEFDESMYRYWVPMDWECLQEYKQDKQKLEAITDLVISYNPKHRKRDGRKSLYLALTELLGVEE